jgi:hypothetical protein
MTLEIGLILITMYFSATCAVNKPDKIPVPAYKFPNILETQPKIALYAIEEK